MIPSHFGNDMRAAHAADGTSNPIIRENSRQIPPCQRFLAFRRQKSGGLRPIRRLPTSPATQIARFNRKLQCYKPVSPLTLDPSSHFPTERLSRKTVHHCPSNRHTSRLEIAENPIKTRFSALLIVIFWQGWDAENHESHASQPTGIRAIQGARVHESLVTTRDSRTAPFACLRQLC